MLGCSKRQGTILVFLLLLWRVELSHCLELWISRGKLSNLRSSLEVVTQLSKNLQQSVTWWQLANVDWHPESLWRFMVLGAPPPGIFPNQSWTRSEQLEVQRRRGLEATKEASVADYSTEVVRTGTGRIKINAWALMYNCLSEDCDIVAPVVLTLPSTGSNKTNYGTLWQKLYEDEVSNPNASANSNPILVSASTADIYNKTSAVEAASSGSSRLRLRVASRISQCNASIAFGRDPLDAAYKASPGRCYENLPQVKKALNQSYMFAALEDQPHEYNWPYKPAPLERCTNAPVLVKKLEYFRTCVFSPVLSLYCCANFTVADYDGTSCTNDKVNISISTFMLVYTYINDPTLTAKLSYDFRLVNDSAPGAPCNTSGRTMMALYTANHSSFSLSHSIWEDSGGTKVDEFSFGRVNGGFCYYGIKSEEKADNAYLRRCYVSTTLNTTVSRCDPTAADLDLLNVMFNDTVTAYTDEHITAFNMDRGPATDLFTAWAASVTAALSVVSATVPCTNLELEYLARFVFPKKHEKLKLLKFLAVALANVLFGMILYAPIFAMMQSESKRAQPYNTWSLLNNDMRVNTFGSQMRTIVIIQGESVYKSRILLIFVIVCGITFPLIVLLTLKRSYKVFSRRKLLLLEKFKDGEPFDLSHTEAKEINVRAIEMGLSEYVRLQDEINKRYPARSTNKSSSSRLSHT